MATLWQRRRKAAREAGAYHADSGFDTRAHHARFGQDCADAYDDAYADRRREREEQIAREEEQIAREIALRDHPATISREASALSYRTNDSSVMELARLVERLADYIIEKEQNP